MAQYWYHTNSVHIERLLVLQRFIVKADAVLYASAFALCTREYVPISDQIRMRKKHRTVLYIHNYIYTHSHIVG